jgi:hypothetical protein
MNPRPFQYYSEAELLDERRRLDEEFTRLRRELSRMVINLPGAGQNNPVVKVVKEQVAQLEAEISSIGQELAFRRSERAARP